MIEALNKLVLINHIRLENNIAYVEGRGYLKAEMVARMHVDEAASIEEVMEQYHLSEAQVYACLAYYYDNRAALDAEHEAAWAEIRANTIKGSEHLAQLRARLAERPNDEDA
jgi:uncharacterized protein (DUF433 family)